MSNKRFLDEIYACSERLTSHTREWQKHIEFSVIQRSDSNSLTLDVFQSKSRGGKMGEKFMRHLTETADQHGVTLELISMPDDPKYFERLMSFYKKHGFQCFEGQLLMTREPKPAPAPSENM
ncbi:MAG: hypothetical protein ACK4VI_09875 [Alphaproteobacteria bacterium]